MRTTIDIRGARQNNLCNVSLEIPRDQLTVFTGVSGSGKSSLAFDTLYAEGQRRYLESLSSFARNFVEQVQRPDVDFIHGLSPVVSIGQKTVTRSPRSTVGTMTDVAGYLNLLFATLGTAHCPYCRAEVPVRSRAQIVERLLALPEGTAIELRAPIFPVYGEDLAFLFAEVRKKGCRQVVLGGRQVVDISEEADVQATGEQELQAVVDRFVIRHGIAKQLAVGVENALLLGERFLSVHVTAGDGADRLAAGFGCPEHHLLMGDLQSVH
ncbi:MAG TPA: excinuclease ABC subunit UvrA, partial [Bacillota bacterium]|nr:excinuclease ABC subunit UvrA [Bacillota bacterium]